MQTDRGHSLTLGRGEVVPGGQFVKDDASLVSEHSLAHQAE